MVIDEAMKRDLRIEESKVGLGAFLVLPIFKALWPQQFAQLTSLFLCILPPFFCWKLVSFEKCGRLSIFYEKKTSVVLLLTRLVLFSWRRNNTFLTNNTKVVSQALTEFTFFSSKTAHRTDPFPHHRFLIFFFQTHFLFTFFIVFLTLENWGFSLLLTKFNINMSTTHLG